MNICVYAIAKDEEKHVERFCTSAREADSIVVLDTGSTDRTVELLQKFGATVYEANVSPWRFDDARNLSMALIPPATDVCVCLDLDEVLCDGWRAALETEWTPETTRANYRYTWSFHQDGSEDVVYWADKIHAYGCYRWRHPVHEVLSYEGDKQEVMTPINGLRIEHHSDPTKSRAQYLPLLELSVREAPDDDRNCHYLGREYMYRGEWGKAIDTLKKHLSLPTATWADERAASMRFLAKCYRALGLDDTAEQWLIRAIAEAPHLREPLIDYSAMLYARKDWLGLACVTTRAVSIVDRGKTYITEGYAWGALPWDYLSIAQWQLGNVKAAREANEQAMKFEPNDARLLANAEFFQRKMQGDNAG